MSTSCLGIDVAQATLECCLFRETRRFRRQVPNTPEGFTALAAWIGQHDATGVPVCLEATGGYEEAVATVFAEQGATVYVANPYRIKRWGESALLRTKTDRVDAQAIAEFGRTAQKLHPWQPLPPAFRALRDLERYRRDLCATRQAYQNRRSAPGCGPTVAEDCAQLLAALDAQLATVDAQIGTLLTETPDLQQTYILLRSIIGIGHVTAVLLLGEIGDARQFQEGGQLVAHAGVSVRHADSGTSVHAHPRLSKRGNAALRAGLYFPAMTAMRHLPHLRAFAQRLAARGCAPKEIICAVMRKLLELIFAVLRDRRPYDPQYRHPRAQQAAIPTPTSLPHVAEGS